MKLWIIQVKMTVKKSCISEINRITDLY